MPDPTALVVDDEPLILMDTADMVASAGYHVIEARSADEAVELLAKYRSLKLLVTDVQMPGPMDGIALARYVGEHWPGVHVLVASGAVTPEAGEIPQGARFVGKPLNQVLVIETLQELERRTPILPID